MGKCAVCGREGIFVSEAVGACGQCLAEGKPEALAAAEALRAAGRRRFGLPEAVPASGSAECRICANACRPGEGEPGYCGARVARGNAVSLRAGRGRAFVEWYYDPLPTNCVAAWACAATGAGYPKYAYRPGGEGGYYNLAVFYNGCNFDCLYCQNWHHRRLTAAARTAEELARAALNHRRVSCICYFGGDPTPQIEHALRASELALEGAEAAGRIVRICWETNGGVNSRLMERMVELSLRSGGTVKFDLKAWTPALHRALCGAENRRTLENFELAASRIPERPEVPLVAASTLLVPGYITASEVGAIARFIARLDPSIPYSLLAFHPDYLLSDIPPTPRQLAEQCLEAAREAGLERVRIGNVHLLW